MTSSNDDETSPSSGIPRAIVAGHGDFPRGLVSAVDQISGRGGIFLPISNRDLSGTDLESMLRDQAAAGSIRVFFTDLPGGSATLAVRRMMRLDPGVVLVTGTNLATLLEFAFQTDADVVSAARTAAEKGRIALVASGGG